MSVSDGQRANQATFNNAFISKTTASTGVAVVALVNVDTASGDGIYNLQREFNYLNTYLGSSKNSAATGLPTWNSDSIGTANDDVTTRVDAIQTEVEANQTNISSLLSSANSWTKYTLTASDFSTAATSTEISLATLSAGEAVQGFVIKHSTAFSGGSITDYDISVGPSGDATKYIDSFDVDQTVAASAFQTIQTLDVPDFAATSVLAVQAVSTGDTLDNATTGTVEIWVLSSELG